MRIQTNYLSDILFLFLMIFITGCSKKEEPCPDAFDNYYDLTYSDRNKVPYYGKETLTFISNEGDTAMFSGQGTRKVYSTQQINCGRPVCPCSTNNFEKQRVEFKSQSTFFKDITFNLYRYEGVNEPYSSSFNWYIQYNTFEYRVNYILDTTNYKDTVTVKGIIQNCLRITGFPNETTKIYYHKDFGIVRMAITGGVVWDQN